MKTKFLKVSLLILAFSLVLGAAVATIVSANTAEAKTPEIISQNVKYTDQFLLMYAVDKNTVSDLANLKLSLYDKDPSAPDATLIRTYTEYTEVVADPTKNNLSADSYVFTTDGVAATGMLTEIYVQAACGTAVSNVKKYSVAEYLYERLASEDLDQKQAQFYAATIDFGASAQKIVGGATADTKLITDYSYVEVIGGTINGVNADGMYLEGTVLTLDGEDSWYLTTYDEIGEFKTVPVTNGTFTVADGIKNKLTKKVNDYKDGIATLNDLYEGKLTLTNNYTSDNRFYTNTSGASISYVYSGDHAVAAEFNISNRGNTIRILPTDTSVAAADAKAFECSFDMKMNTPGSKNQEPIELLLLSDGGSRFRTNFYARYEGHRDFLRVNCPPSSTPKGKNFDDVNPADWIHVRAVIYANDLSTVYFYINDNEAWVHTYPGGAVDFTKLQFGIRNYTAGYYSSDVKVKDENGNVVKDENGNDVTETVWYGNAGEQVTVLVDNYYCGYTMEENPYVAN